MDFALFLLLNALLLLRPEELFPEIAGLRLYLIVIVVTGSAALPKLLDKLNLVSLYDRPVAVCALGSLFVIFLSAIPTGNLPDSLELMGEFAKVLLYFFLLLSVVDTPAKFQTFVGWLVVFVVGLTAASLAHLNKWYEFPDLDPVMQRYVDPETGQETWVPRLIGSGFFHDPNDLCLILSFGILCCIYKSKMAQLWAVKFAWLVPIALFLYAMQLTYSRGGILGLFGGTSAYLYGRYGWKRALPLAVAVVILTAGGMGGRQADTSGGDTMHERIMLWASGFVDLFGRPLYIPTGFGIGYYIREHYYVAHNSYINAYIETGLLGGGLYLGMFVYAAKIVNWTGLRPAASEWAKRTRPFALSILGAYAVGTYSVTRNYVIPTYLVIGLAVLLWETERPADTPLHLRVNRTWAKHMVYWSVGGFVFLKFFTQFAGQAGL